jgi:hypothetical protein
MQKFIVAEITKNWSQDHAPEELMCKTFEKIINQNLDRGYELHDWKYNTVAGDSMVETIIAVFKLI